MLSQDQNDLLTRTGPGTPGGRLLRRFWQPVAAAEEMPPGGQPMPVRIMGEDLVLFRDPDDRLGLIGLHCPHRGTDLSYGRVEDGGLRCLYHGWAFDIHGNCIDQPAEPEDRKFCHKVRHPAYPVQEKGGAIWAYLGEGEPPLIPDYEFLTAPEENCIVFRVVIACNWLQGLEGTIDPAHTSFLHRMGPPPQGERTYDSQGDNRFFAEDTGPQLEVERTGFGVRIHALRTLATGERYLRVNNYLFPNASTPVGTEAPPVRGYQGLYYVPVDDHTLCRFEFIYNHTEPVDKDFFRRVKAEWVAPDKRHVQRADNRYLQDRGEIARGETFAGLGRYIPAHDALAIETQGAIQDRTREHLGSTDIAIIEVRKILLDAIRRHEAGEDPPGLVRDPAQNRVPEFLCTADYIGAAEDGPAYCRRVLGGPIAAE